MGRVIEKWVFRFAKTIANEFVHLVQFYAAQQMHPPSKKRQTDRNLTKKLYVQTGNLYRAIGHPVREAFGRVFEIKEGRRKVSVIYGIDLKQIPYARIHELGGVIKPKRKKYLRFKLPSGKVVFTKKVRIPPRPYFFPAVTKAFDSLKEKYSKK